MGSGQNSYKILFEIKNILNGVSADKIGIDDIVFTDGPCQDSSDINKVCTFSNGNLCDYKLTSATDFKWKLYEPAPGLTPPISINDHTSGALSSG